MPSKLDTIVKDIGKRLRALESREHAGATHSPVQRFYSENYGSVTDGVTNDRDAIDRLVNTVIVGDARVIVTGSQVIGNDLTIPTNVTLEFMAGSLWTINNGVTLLINGPIQAGMYQIFNCVGTGVVTFGRGSAREVYCDWWGLHRDGVTDDTAAINAALTAAAGRVRNVYLGEGDYAISATLVVSGGVYFRGTSATSRTYLDATVAMTSIRIGAYCKVSHLMLRGHNWANPLSIGIELGIGANDTVEVSHIYFSQNFYYYIYSTKALDSSIIELCRGFTSVGMAAIYLSSAVITAAVSISRCHFGGTGAMGSRRYGIYISGYDTVRLHSNVVNSFDTCVYVTDAGDAPWVASIESLHSEESRNWVFNANRWGAAPGWPAVGLNDIIIPTAGNANGWIYQCTTAGNAGGAEPAWVQGYGNVTNDGGVVWTAVAKSVAIELEGGYREVNITNLLTENRIVNLYINGHGQVSINTWHDYYGDWGAEADYSILLDAVYIGGDSHLALTNCEVTNVSLNNGSVEIHVISRYSGNMVGIPFTNAAFGTIATDAFIDGNLTALRILFGTNDYVDEYSPRINAGGAPITHDFPVAAGGAFIAFVCTGAYMSNGTRFYHIGVVYGRVGWTTVTILHNTFPGNPNVGLSVVGNNVRVTYTGHAVNFVDFATFYIVAQR